MTTQHDTDADADDPMSKFDEIDAIEDLEEVNAPADEVAAAASGALESGTLPLVAGGLALATAIRSLAANRRRAIPLGIVGTGLVGYGLSKRRSSGESADEGGVPDVESGTEGKETSDQASAAANRVDAGRVSEIEPDGEVSDEPEIGETTDAGSEIDFTEEPDQDESRSRPDLGAAEEDPRRETEADGVEVDVSDPALAEEESEAAGPSPEQAQPTQTADTEPEESPADDASHMKVDPPDPDEPESDPDETAAADDGESDATDDDVTETGADAAGGDESDEDR